jgi:hypothetical protein
MGEVRSHTSFYCASIASIRASIRSISGVAPFCQQHLPGQHRLPTSASNIWPRPATSASIICRHLLLTALNLNNQHLNSQHLPQHLGQASQASQPASGQHLAGSPVCCALCASIPSIGASLPPFPASPEAEERKRIFSTRIPRVDVPIGAGRC